MKVVLALRMLPDGSFEQQTGTLCCDASGAICDVIPNAWEPVARYTMKVTTPEHEPEWKVSPLLLLVCLLFSGCAGTVLYNRDGFVAFRTQADATGLRVRSADGAILEAATLIHSVPTVAGGEAVAISGSGVAKAAAGIGAALAVPVLP